MNKRAILASLVLASFGSGYLLGQSRNWELETKTVILHYQKRLTVEGVVVDIVRVPKENTVYMGLVPLDQQAPLGMGDYMVCHPFKESKGLRTVDGKVLGPYDEIAFRCGGKRYLFAHLDIE